MANDTAEGAALVQKMIDGGAPAQQVQEWADGQKKTMVEGGAPADEVAKYWGEKPPTEMLGLAAHLDANLANLSPKEKAKIASNPMEQFAAGLQIGVSGLAIHGKPTLELGPDAGFGAKAFGAAGQALSDLPGNVAGYVVGGSAGAAAGGALTAEEGGIGAPVGAVVGGWAGAAALPEAIRQVAMDHYNHEGTTAPTAREVASRAADIVWNTTKAAIVGGATGAIGGKVGEVVGGAVGETVAGKLATAGAQVGTYAAVGAGAGAALEGRLPEPEDFYTAAVLMIGMHAAGSLIGATKRFVPTAQGEQLAANARDVYAQTGIPPQQQVEMARFDPAMKTALLAPRSAAGDATPGFGKLPDPPPYKAYEPEINAKTEQAATTPAKSIEPHEAPAADVYAGMNPEQIKSQKAAEAEMAAKEKLNATTPAGQVDDKLLGTFYQLEHGPGRYLHDGGPEPTSPAGARGPMQIMPDTARQYGFDPAKLDDYEYNIHASRTILADLSKRYDGRVADMAVAYNAGPGRADAWIRGGRQIASLPLETQKYLMHLEKISGANYGYASESLGAQLHIQGDNGAWEPKALNPRGVDTKPPQADWTRFDEATKDVRSAEVLSDGSIVPAPELIASYLQDFGREADFKFLVGPEQARRGGDNAPIFQERTTKFTRGPNGELIPNEADNTWNARHVYMPKTPDDLTQAWYGLGRYEVLYHEVGHALDFHINGYPGTKTIAPGPLRDEMIATSKNFRPKLWERNPDYNMQPAELMADAIASWISNPTARKMMPEFTAKYGKQLEPYLTIADRALPKKVGNTWEPPPGSTEEPAGGGGVGGPPDLPPDSGMGGANPPGPNNPKQIVDQRMKLNEEMLRDRILDRVAPEVSVRKVPDWMKPWKWFAGFKAQLAPARAIDRQLNLTPQQMGVEDMMRQTFGSMGRTDHFYRVGTLDAITLEKTSENSFLRGFEAVKEDGGDLAGFWAYRLAARTVEKAGQGVNTGLPLDHATEYLAKEGVKEKYERGASIIRAAKDGSIDYARDSGLFTPGAAEAMKDLNQEHIVMRRVMEPGYQPPSPGAGFRARAPVRQMKGSDKLFVDPSTTEIDNLSTIIAMADRNRSLGNIIGAIELNNKTPGKGLIPFAQRTDKAFRLGKETLTGDIQDENGNTILPAGVGRNGGPPEASPVAPFLASKKFNGISGPDDFIYFRDGVPEVWHSEDPNLSEILRTVQPGKLNPLTQMMSKVASLDRAGVTGSIDFPFRAIMHGQIASIFSEGGQWAPYHDIIKGIGSAFKGNWEEDYNRWLANGGGGSSMVAEDLKVLTDNTFDKSSTWTSVSNYIQHPIQALKTLQHMTDTAARVGFMLRNEAAGQNTLKAATQSRKAYLDYGEPFQASWANTWGSMVPFMTTSFKDVTQVTDALRAHPIGTMLKAGAIITMPTFANYAANYLMDQNKKDGDKYTDLPQWKRDMFWNIPIDNHGGFLSLKKPYVGGWLFSTMPEHALDWMRQDDKVKFHGWATAFMEQVMPTIVPTLALPIEEQYANKDMATGQPLIKAGLDKASGYMQYKPDTTITAKALAKVIGYTNIGQSAGLDSPIVVQNYMKEWLGTLPMTMARILETPWQPPGRLKELSDVPFVGSFFARHPGASQTLDDFYENYDRIQKQHTDLALALKEGDPALIARTATPSAVFQISQIGKSIQAQQSAIQTINKSTMTDEEKLKQIDSLTGALIATARAGSQAIEALEKRQ